MKKLTWLLFLLGGCVSSVEPDPSRLGVNFYPLQTGSYFIYQSKLVDFNLNGTIDSTIFFLREEIVDSFPSTDNEGYTFVINQYKKRLQ